MILPPGRKGYCSSCQAGYMRDWRKANRVTKADRKLLARIRAGGAQ